ncbi:hypothetical protein G7067_10950 [Leucobacter insecticola]|uniref:Ribosomally synthesized peptide with SipW-like signal peptide n=1 Tax=Leucobacter insecticola TaxID=2714934 RepID=A0A6G8FK05_9MICO|nr:hypothetical protein [Leucobacter insecticola]QIM16800.1 hypothetical protein G7067_10950 [Leucobacter insecticola]
MRTGRAIGGPRTAGLRAGSLCVALISTAFATVLGLSSVGGTYAWLNASAPAPGATVQAGSFGLEINGAVSTSLGSWVPSPETPAVRAFNVSNTGDAPALLEAQVSRNTEEHLFDYALATLTPVAGAEACEAGLGVPSPLPEFTTPASWFSLPVGETRWFCLEIGLRADTPYSVNGDSVQFKLTVRGDQDAG